MAEPVPIIPNPLELDAVLSSSTEEKDVAHIVKMKTGATRPTLEFHTKDDDGEIVPINNGTPVFKIRAKDGTATLIYRSCTILGDGLGGTCRFAWQAADWNILSSGEYEGEYSVIFSDATNGKVFDNFEFRFRSSFA